jgi:hypothetical protein
LQFFKDLFLLCLIFVHVLASKAYTSNHGTS